MKKLIFAKNYSKKHMDKEFLALLDILEKHQLSARSRRFVVLCDIFAEKNRAAIKVFKDFERHSVKILILSPSFLFVREMPKIFVKILEYSSKARILPKVSRSHGVYTLISAEVNK